MIAHYCDAGARSFVVAVSSSCMIPSDWLSTLSACIISFPEVELFFGNCRPIKRENASHLQRLAYDLELYPRAVEGDGFEEE
jgi:hypothetical protein